MLEHWPPASIQRASGAVTNAWLKSRPSRSFLLTCILMFLLIYILKFLFLTQGKICSYHFKMFLFSCFNIPKTHTICQWFPFKGVENPRTPVLLMPRGPAGSRGTASIIRGLLSSRAGQHQVCNWHTNSLCHSQFWDELETFLLNLFSVIFWCVCVFFQLAIEGN